MNPLFFLKCFGIGASVAAAVGPIFVLTFNRAASRGWCAGFVTGIGSGCADAMYFTLGLVGLLQVVTRMPLLLRGMYLCGGGILVAMGAVLFVNGVVPVSDRGHSPSYWKLFGQSFGMTSANPTVILFFVTVSARVLGPLASFDLSILTIVGAVTSLLTGAALIYATTATVGWYMGKKLPAWLLQRIAQVVGLSVICLGLFLVVGSVL
ncbi:MAG: LysE family transporter [Candidatus Dependentiae bacterium]|jgi:threonine/homoserine/homoserine lactone efflux protein